MPPKISIVTPTYNSAQFLEATIQSILSQNYPNLEYIIIDGGSTDGTVEIIQRYEEHLAYWVSEPDNGMYDAIQKGFDKATGEIMAWLNSDDLYNVWVLDSVSRLFEQFSEVEWLTTNLIFGINEIGQPLYVSPVPGYSREGYYAGEHVDIPSSQFTIEYIVQESTFWRRSLWEKSGARLDTSMKYAGDTELWFRFFQHATLFDVSIPLGIFRISEGQITTALRTQYDKEVETLLERYQVKRHTALSAFLRKLAHNYTPRRFQPLLHRWGLLRMSHNIKYHVPTQRWIIRQSYY